MPPAPPGPRRRGAPRAKLGSRRPASAAAARRASSGLGRLRWAARVVRRRAHDPPPTPGVGGAARGGRAGETRGAAAERSGAPGASSASAPREEPRAWQRPRRRDARPPWETPAGGRRRCSGSRPHGERGRPRRARAEGARQRRAAGDTGTRVKGSKSKSAREALSEKEGGEATKPAGRVIWQEPKKSRL